MLLKEDRNKEINKVNIRSIVFPCLTSGGFTSSYEYRSYPGEGSDSLSSYTSREPDFSALCRTNRRVAHGLGGLWGTGKGWRDPHAPGLGQLDHTYP